MRKIYLLTTIVLSLFLYSNLNAACTNVTSSFTTSTTDVCGANPTIISFVNNSTGINSSTAGYSWYVNGALFGNTTGLTIPPTDSIYSIGTYNYMLIAYDTANSCRDTSNIIVTIHPIPLANFGFPTGIICPNTPITFTDSSTGTTSGTTYNWDFGDGGSSTNTSPNYTYPNGGNYNVTLIITNFVGCSDTLSLSVSVITTPNISIAGDDGDGDLFHCLSPVDTTTQEVVTFFNTSDSGVIYTWDFGDGSPVYVDSTLANFTHIFNYGTFTVVCSATDSNGCFYSDTLTVIFEKFVSSSFTVPLTQTSGCTPHLVTPVNASVNALNYIWDFGDGSPSITTNTLVAPSHTYTQTGFYTITLIAYNPCNSSTSTVGPIIVSEAPMTSFNHTLVGRGCSPQNVTFNNTSLLILPANNFSWDMGNGNTFNGVPPTTQTYTQGSYTITLIGGNGCGNDTAIQIIDIDSLPYGGISLFPTQGCSPLTVNASAIGFGYDTTFNWLVDGTLVGIQDTIPTQTFVNNMSNSIANHTIRFELSNHCGIYDTTTIITVHPEVIARITPSNPLICIGDSIVFSSNSSGDSLTYFWDFGNGTTSTLLGPHTIQYPTQGTDTITLIVSGFCGKDTVQSIVITNPYPIANIIPDTLSGCEDLPVTFINGAGNSASYAWKFTGSIPSISTQYNPSVLFTSPGNNQVSLIVDSFGCQSFDTTFVDVFPGPQPAFTTIPSSGCSPLTVSFNNTSSIVTGDNYLWDFGIGNTDTVYSPSDTIYTTILTPTTYPVKLIITTINGCKDSLTRNVTVHPIPISGFTIAKDSFCEKESILFTDTSIGATSFKWYFGDGDSSSVQHPTHSYDTAGNYIITLVSISGANCVDTSYDTITINQNPVAVFYVDTACLTYLNSFTDSSLYNPISWQWSFGDGNTNSIQNPTHLYLNDSSFPVKLVVTNSYGCTDSIIKNALVYPTPTAGFTMSTACAKIQSLFIDTSLGSPSKWNWNFGDGGTDTVQNPLHIYLVGGNYNVTLIVENVAGCIDTIIQNIYISTVPLTNFNADTVCIGFPTVFNNTTVLSLPALSYFWDFGDGNTSNLANPTYQYLATGTYTVSLTVQNINGCDSTYVYPVVVDSLPTASFIFDTVCLNNPTSFTSTSLGNPTLFIWNFGDGSPLDSNSTGVNSHVYSSGGSYLVKLITVNIHGCKDSISYSILVYPNPIANFVPVEDTVCLNSIISFLNNSTNAVSYKWYFGDGDSSSLINPSHLYLTPGTFQVQLIVYTNFGCEDTSSFSVTVHPNPVANFFADTVCLNAVTSFVDSSLGSPISWNWNFGDGNIDSVQNPTHIYLIYSAFYTQLIVTNQFGCTDTILKSILVLPKVDADFYSFPSCLNRTTIFTDTSRGSPVFWNWDFGDGNFSSAQNPIHTYSSSGIFTVTLIVTNSSGCSDTLVKNHLVNRAPTPDFTGDTVCYGFPTSFTNLTTSYLPITSYFWDFGDGNTDTSQNPIHLYSASGIYNVLISTTNSGGCNSFITISILVNSPPTANFIFDTVCLNNPTSFVSTSVGSPSPTLFIWDFGDGSPLDSNTTGVNSHIYASAGSYLVKLITENIHGCKDSISYSIIVYPSPASAFIPIDDTVCFNSIISFLNNSTNAISYKWYFGDGDSSSLINPSHLYLTTGTFQVQLIAYTTFSCSDTSFFSVTVHPNPIANFFADTVCLTATTSFVGSSLGNPVSWSWNFGDGNIDSVQNPIHNYLSSGIYNVSLFISDSNSCTNSIIIPVLVDSLPTANFIYDTVCLGNSTTFTSTSLGNPTLSIWNFGDGSPLDTTLSIISTHVFSAVGSYNVKLITQNIHGCLDSISYIVNVHPSPISSFISLDDSVCLNSPITFLNNSIGGFSYQWNFGDGNTSTTINPTHTYSTSGNFQVQLITFTYFNCPDTSSFTVTVHPNPIANFAVDTVCLLSANTFSNLSTGIPLIYSWNFGDGNLSSSQNPTHIYSFDSTYYTQLIVNTQYNCADSITKAVVILPRIDADFIVSNACANRPVLFSDTSVGIPTQWNWNFGDGNSSTLQNPIHVYLTNGSFNVTLIVTNGASCSDTITKILVVNTIPIPNFTADTVCFGNITSFTNLTTNSLPIINYLWQFGDGNISNAQSPSYSYSAPGSYNVTLTVTNSGGCDTSITKTILVNALPVADFIHDTVCLGLATTFIDNSTGIPTQWVWNFGDFSPLDSTGAMVTHAYNTAGTFTASLIVKSGINNCRSTSIKIITVLGGANASFSAPTPICDSSAILFVNNSTATSGTIINSTWSFGDGTTSTLTHPTHTYATPGVYLVSLFVSSNLGCIDKDSVNIVVNPLPVANFGFTKNVCINNPTQFTDSSFIGGGNISAWAWNFGDGNTSTLQNPINIYTASGIYQVTLTIFSDSGCSDIITKNLIINQNANLNFTFKPVCLGDSMIFTNFSSINSPDSIVSWLWNFGDGGTSTLKNPSHIYTSYSQTFNVTLSVVTKFGCTKDTTITVSHFPIPLFNYKPNKYDACLGEIISFTDSSSITAPSSIVSRKWSFGDGNNSFLPNPTHIYRTQGAYNVTLQITTSNSCLFIDSTLPPINIYPNPVADFTPTPPRVSIFYPVIFFNNKSTGAVNYDWDFGDGNTSVVSSPNYRYSAVGYYSVRLIAHTIFGCRDTAVNQVEVKDDYSIYVPNSFTPNGDIHNQKLVVSGHQIFEYNFKIFDRWGELVFESNAMNDSWDGTQNGVDSPIGAYVYILNSTDINGNRHTKRGHISLIR